MTDVLEIALERRTKLQKELKQLDDFMQMAERLVRAAGEGGAAPSNEATSAPIQQPARDTSSEQENEDSSADVDESKWSDTEVRSAPAADDLQIKDASRPNIFRRVAGS